MYYIMLIFAAALQACDFALNKIYQRSAGTAPRAGFGFNALLGLMSAGIFFAAGGFRLHITPYSLAMAAAMAALVMSYNIIGFRILKRGSMALYTLFLMTGGMVVPYLWGLVFLDEGFLWIRALGAILIVSAVAFSNFGKEQARGVPLSLCLLVFVINGFTSVVSKTHQIEPVLKTVSATDFVILVGLCKFVISGIAYTAVRVKDRKHLDGEGERKSAKSSLLIVLGSAALSGASYYLQLLGASRLSATVLYPILTGGTMILSALAGVIFFGDKLTKNLVIGLCLCFAGTLLFL